SDDTLSATLSGIPAGWTVRDGAVVLANGARSEERRVGKVGVTAPALGGEREFLTLTVSTSEGAGTSAVETLTVHASGVAELPVFGAPAVGSVSEQLVTRLNTCAPPVDSDDTLSATLSGIPAGWTVRDGAVVLANGA